MKTNLNVTTAQEVYETMVEKIYQIPSALVSRDWQKVNVEFLEFVSEVGMNPLFKEPLLVLNSVLLFGIAEDYELGYNIATPIYNNIKNRKGFSSIWELKLFIRVSFLLCRNFSELKELTQYGFDFLESLDDSFTYEKITLTVNMMYALIKMNPKDSLEHKNEIEEIFDKLHLTVLNLGEKYHIEVYVKHANSLKEEFKNKEQISIEEEIEELKKRYDNLLGDLDDHRKKLGYKYKTERLYSIFSKISSLGGKL